MDLYICDESMEPVFLVDNYKSLIWAERYNECGDFEIAMPYNREICHYLSDDQGLEQPRFLRIKESDVTMVIEEISVLTDSEEGDSMEIKGRSLESILDRRVIYGQVDMNDLFETGIQFLLTQNAINPSNLARQIPGLSFRASGDTRIGSLTIETQFYCDNLYDAIVDLCKTNHVGFKLRNSGSGMIFQLFMGEDRSLGQTDNLYVIFSPRFDNLLNSNYVESVAPYKNIQMIAGNGDRSARLLIDVPREGAAGVSGLLRREFYTDATDISRTIEVDGRTKHLTDEEYTELLANKAKEEFPNNDRTRNFDGEIESSHTFVYGTDYFLGDLVEIENEYGMSDKVRVSELIRSYDSDGYKEYPTFEKIEDEQEEL